MSRPHAGVAPHYEGSSALYDRPRIPAAGVSGPQGELTMRSASLGGTRPFRMDATGSIDANGTAHVRQSGASCSYDFIWQKTSK